MSSTALRTKDPVARPDLPDLPGLRFLLDPFPVDVFLAEYWEKKVLHVSRDDPGYYRDLFRLKDLDSFLGHSLTNDEISIAKEGNVFFPEVEGSKKTSLYQFYEAYAEGHTPVARNIHLCWEPIGDVADELAREFGCYVSTYLYPTPENSQGFSSHWDDHDIFALQLEGEKEWRLYDGGPQVPRYRHERNDYRRTDRKELGEPSRIVNLKAGDLLYFPKGVIHEPRARTRSSLHVTFGLYPETWEFLVTTALEVLAETHPELQTCVPFGFLSASTSTDETRALMEGFGSRLTGYLPHLSQGGCFSEAITRLAAKVVGRVSPVADGHFARLLSTDGVGPGTRIEKRKGAVGVVVSGADGVTLHYPGGTHAMGSELEAPLRFIVDQERFCVRDIPGVPDEIRIHLVRQLIGIGYLKIANS